MSDTDDRSLGSLEFGLLGPFEVRRDGKSLALGGRRQRAVLAMLACQAGHAVSVERLVDGVWGDPAPSGVVTSVQSYVFHLRQVLEPDRPRGTPGHVLVTVPGGYRLAISPASVDVARFEELVAAGDAAAEVGRPDRAAEAYAAALAWWRGDVLEDLADHEFVVPVRARLHERRAAALQARFRAELDLGHHLAVLPELESVIADHPLREELHALRMLALYRSGRQSDALAAYRDLRAVLDEELGIEPSPPLQELNSKILRQDPSLAPPPVVPTAAAPRPLPRPAPRPLPGPAPRQEHADGRPRIRALAVVIAVVLGLAGGASLPVARAPIASAAVPANAVSELDESGRVVESVPIGADPVAITAGAGAIWVLSAGDRTVYRIDPTRHAIVDTIQVGQDPRGLAVTGDDLWVTNFGERTVTRINMLTNGVVDTIEVGTRPDAIAAGPAGLWVANSGDNTIQRIDTETGAPAAPVLVDDGPDGLAVDEDSVWVAHGRSGTVWQINAATGDQMAAPIIVGSGPRGLARVDQDVWVANELSASVTRIDVTTRRPHPLDVGEGPTDLAVLGDGIWVAEKYAGDLLRIDRTTTDVDRFDLGAPVTGVTTAGGRVWAVSGAFAATTHLGGELRVMFAEPAVYDPGLWAVFDPARVYDIWSTPASRILYDGLVALKYSGVDPQVLVPDLADAVPTPTDGGRTYVFHLRPGIRYSTGEEVRASDVELGVRRALYWRGDEHAARPDLYAGIVGGQACIDDWTSCDLSDGVVTDDDAGRVTFHLVAPDPEFLYKLTMLVAPAPPGTPVGGLDSPLPSTGPYQVAPSDEGTLLTLTRNPWFRQWSLGAQPAGFPDTITWQTVSSSEEAAHAVEDGRADVVDVTVAGKSDPDELTRLVEGLERTAPDQLHHSTLLGTGYLALDSSRPPFNNLLARRAVNFALDRTKAVELGGGPSLARLTCQLMPPGMPSYRPYCPYTRGPPDGAYRGPDLDRARQLVRASGTLGTAVEVGDRVGDYDRLPPLCRQGPALTGLPDHHSPIPQHRRWCRRDVQPFQRCRGGGHRVRSGLPRALDLLRRHVLHGQQLLRPVRILRPADGPPRGRSRAAEPVRAREGTPRLGRGGPRRHRPRAAGRVGELHQGVDDVGARGELPAGRRHTRSAAQPAVGQLTLLRAASPRPWAR